MVIDLKYLLILFLSRLVSNIILIFLEQAVLHYLFLKILSPLSLIHWLLKVSVPLL